MNFDKRKYPLRKVIERDVLISGGEKNANGYIVPKIFGNRLECGHVIRPAKDFYGEIHSESQRCRECYNQSKTIDMGNKIDQTQGREPAKKQDDV